MNAPFSGIIDDNRLYTRKALAQVLGFNEEWIMDHLIHKGCHHRRVGSVYFLSGATVRLFIEQGSEVWQPPAKRGKQRDVAG